jgi:hypothetical protein
MSPQNAALFGQTMARHPATTRLVGRGFLDVDVETNR